MLSAGVDAVTITTPPQTREELVLEAIAAGVPVVADKPFAPNAQAGRKLDLAAKAKGVISPLRNEKLISLNTPARVRPRTSSAVAPISTVSLGKMFEIVRPTINEIRRFSSYAAAALESMYCPSRIMVMSSAIVKISSILWVM